MTQRLFNILIIVFQGFILIATFIGCYSNEIKNDKKLVMILVENELYQNIENEIERFKNDLMKENYEVYLNTSDINSQTKPPLIREILQKEFKQNENIEGAIFVGNLTAPLFNINKDLGDPYWHDYLADFYYMDLDGIWNDTNNDGILDDHRETDSEIINKLRRILNFDDLRKPDIWVSRIRCDKLTSLGDEIELMKKYFDKNHNYRKGELKLPPKRAFSISAGVDFTKSQWGAYPEKIYSDIDKEVYHDSLGHSLRNFLSSDEGYEFGIINVFSGPRIHHFSHFFDEIDQEWWRSREGRKKIAEYSDTINDSNVVSWNDIKEIQPKVLFYHLFTSEVGRHDFKDYLGGMYLFSGMGLVAVAGTQHSGSVGNLQFYEALADGMSVGQAWQKSLIWLVENSEEEISIVYYPNSEQKIKAGKSKYKAVLLGDGTLKLPQR